MPTSALATFAAVLSSFRGHFTAPTFVRFVILAVGWILSCDPSAGVWIGLRAHLFEGSLAS